MVEYPSEEEKTIVEMAMSSDKLNDWSIITIPFPNHYDNHSLYFVGHLDSDNICQDIEKVLPLVTEQLTASFSQLGSTLKTVIINSLQEADTLMEIENTTDASKGAESGLNQLPIVGVRFISTTLIKRCCLICYTICNSILEVLGIIYTKLTYICMKVRKNSTLRASSQALELGTSTWIQQQMRCYLLKLECSKN